MATGLNASVTTYVSGTVISSAAANTNNANLNGAVNPSFATVSVDQQQNFTKPLGGSNQAYISINPSDGANWSIGEQASDHGLYFAVGSVQFEVHPTKGIKPRSEGYFISGLSFFTGTTSGTYNHNLGTTPDGVLAMQSTSGSSTYGFDTAGSSTVHITSGAGAAFTAMAFNMNA